MSLLNLYYRQVQKRPMLTQSIMASTMWVLGDCLAQNLENYNLPKNQQPKPYNYSRTLKMGLIGLCWNGPFSSWWLRFLDRKFTSSTHPNVIFKKLFCDQVFQNPTLTSGVILLVGLSNNLGFEKSVNVVKTDLLDVMYRGWVYWTLIQIINFRVVPLNYRLLFVQIMAIIWNGYLSLTSNQSIENVKEEEDATVTIQKRD